MKLSKFAKYYLFFVIVVILGAANTKTNLLTLFTAFLISLLLVSWGLGKNNFKLLAVSFESPQEVFAKTACAIRYLIANGSIYHKFGIQFNDPVIQHSFTLVEVPAYTTIGITHDIPKERLARRGIYRWRELTIHSGFPFGLLQYERKIAVDHTLLVLPKPLSFSALSLPTKASMFREGSFVSTVTRTASQDFSGLREYQSGDSQKNIHWKATAKAGKLFVKEYEEDLPAGVSIILDIWPDHSDDEADGGQGFGRLFEDAITVTASLVWEVAHQGYLILFAQGQHFVAYGRGSEHALHILRILAPMDARQDTAQRDAVVTAIEKIPNGTTAIFIFWKLRAEITQYLAQLAQSGCQVIAIALERHDAGQDIPGVQCYHVREIQPETVELERIS